jgi:dTDP-4-dehydrorhamnose reductase
MSTNNPRLFCFGLGYTARRLGERLIGAGWRIAGTTRDGDKVTELGALGFEVGHTEGGGFGPGLAAALRGASHVLISVPPDDDGDPVARRHGADIAALPGLRWLGYLSSTAVYGDRGGGWVDETTACAPSSQAGRRRLAAEAAWLGLWRERGVPAHVFRLAGIYGSGRSALDRVRAGTARRIVKPGHVLSRIHVDDIAAVLAASIARPRPGAIYNLCDDRPASGAEVTAFAARLLGVAPPPEIPFDSAEVSPEARRFFADDRRVRNDLIKTELGVSLAYPDYESGLCALCRMIEK